MDIPRAPVKNRKRLIQGGIGVGVLIVLTLIISSLSPAAPPVDRGTLWVDSVRQGPMVRDLRGPGTLVPEHIRYITALSAGRVDKVLAQPSSHVKPGDVLLELSNPDVQIQALQAEEQLTAARAQLVSLRTTLETQRLAQAGTLATMRTAYAKAQRDVSEAEQGRIQGALMSLASLAGIISPMIFAGTFALFIGKEAPAHLPGAPWYLAAVFLLVGFLVAWRFARPKSAPNA